MESEEIRELRANLLKLKQEHRDLDSAINALEESGRADQLQLKRLKKKKLFLKDDRPHRGSAPARYHQAPEKADGARLELPAGEHEKPSVPPMSSTASRRGEWARDPVDDQVEDAARGAIE
jgi:hypothetical protein